MRAGPSQTRSSHADDGGTELVRSRGEHLGQQLVRVGRRLDGGEEQLVLAAEVVVHERRVDAGVGRDAADRRAVEPALGERRPGGGQDGVPGVGVAGPPARPAVRDGAQLVLRRSVAAARASASRAAPATTAMSIHIVAVAVAERPTSCRASTA